MLHMLHIPSVQLHNVAQNPAHLEAMQQKDGTLNCKARLQQITWQVAKHLEIARLDTSFAFRSLKHVKTVVLYSFVQYHFLNAFLFCFLLKEDMFILHLASQCFLPAAEFASPMVGDPQPSAWTKTPKTSPSRRTEDNSPSKLETSRQVCSSFLWLFFIVDMLEA